MLNDLETLYEELEIHPKYWEALNNEKDSIRNDIIEHIEQIELLRWMVNKNRPYASDLEKDSKGRVIVNIENPHILEDMDFFRERALYFQTHNVYTHLYPNRHPNSEYMKFWKEEARRCIEGLIREKDGEWIPGYYYWYLNYSPILQTQDILDEHGNPSGRADRVYDFPKVWDSDYMFYHYVEKAESLGKFGDVLKTRGRGYSFKCSSMLDRNFFHLPKTKSYALASESEYLTADGILNKAWDTMDFVDEHTAWRKSREKKNTMDHRIASYTDPESGVTKGFKSEIIGVTLKNNPEKARGKRGKLLLFEESGVFPGLLKAWSIARPSLEDGPSTFGFMVAFGTGGTEGAAFAGAEELFYNPKGYRVLGLRNVFDKVRGKGECAFFVPEYMNRKNSYDVNGNSDVVKALSEIFIGREIIRLNTSDPNTLTQEKADRPITPQESIMRKEGTLFPVGDLKDYLAEIMPGIIKFTSIHYIGRLSVNPDTGIVEYKPDADAKVVREFPIKDNINKEGAIEIYELPKTGFTGEVQRFRYIAGIDPYDDDESTTNSLGSMFVMDVLTDRIVCEYTGRPKMANMFYENCLRILKFYNAIANYENDKKGLFSYFSNRNQLSYLADNPQILKDMEYVKATNLSGNKAHPYSEKVYTPSGIKKWKDIKIGDVLFNSYGGITKVIDIPFDNITDIYKITLKDGRVIRASENHLWKIIDKDGYKKVLNTKYLQENLFVKKGRYNECRFYIPKNEGVEYDNKKVEIAPYLLGLFLGDGCMTQSRHHQFYFTSNIPDLENYKKHIPFEIKTLDDRHHRILIKNIGKKLTNLGLQETKSRTKFIPDIYKYNSKEVRLSILQGLLDADGCIGYGGNPEYCSTSEILSTDIMEVARSLGINCNLNIINNSFGKVFKVRFYSEIPLFKLERKYSKQKITKTRAYKTGIVNIELIGQEKSKCVTVDSKDSCYLIGEYITTHNSKGTNSGTKINAWARRLQADWMLAKANADESMMNLHKIRSIGYLKEAINWNADGNFDRVSAMGMLMILREEYYKYILQLKEENTKIIGSDHADDPFFTKNWDSKKSFMELNNINNKSYEALLKPKFEENVYNGKIKLKA